MEHAQSVHSIFWRDCKYRQSESTVQRSPSACAVNMVGWMCVWYSPAVAPRTGDTLRALPQKGEPSLCKLPHLSHLLTLRSSDSPSGPPVVGDMLRLAASGSQQHSRVHNNTQLRRIQAAFNHKPHSDEATLR